MFDELFYNLLYVLLFLAKGATIYMQTVSDNHSSAFCRMPSANLNLTHFKEKNMKKSIAVLLALVVVCTLPALSSCEKSAYETFSAAYERFNQLDEIDAEMNAVMKMEMTGMTIEVPVNYVFTAKGLQGDTPVMGGTMKMSMMGQDIEALFYYDSSDYYISSEILGNFRISADAYEIASEYDVLSDMESMIVDLPEELFENVTFTKNEDGSKTAELTMTSEMFMSLYTDFANEMAASALDGYDTDTVSVEDIKISLTIDKNGNLISVNTFFIINCTMSLMGNTIEAKVTADCSIKINNPGQSVTVNPPEGYKEFPDINSSIF